MGIGRNEGTDVSLDEPSCLRLNLLEVGRNSVISQTPLADRRDPSVSRKLGVRAQKSADGFIWFFQSLTEAAKAVPGLLVGSLPESGAEIGNHRGREALARYSGRVLAAIRKRGRAGCPVIL